MAAFFLNEPLYIDETGGCVRMRPPEWPGCCCGCGSRREHEALRRAKAQIILKLGREEMARRLAARKARMRPADPPPRYDDVFWGWVNEAEEP